MTKLALKDAAVLGTNIYLRFPRVADLKEFIALNRASKRLHRGVVSPPTQPEEFHALLERCSRDDFVCFVVCRIEDGAIAGAINLSQIFRGGFQNAYLGYYSGAEFAGRGYMTEAIDLVLKYAFENLRLHRLEANIQPQNLASIAIVKRAGFVLEGYSRRYLKICGRWRDHERWAIIAEDWRTSRKQRR
jgi:[ribosomal protein S5]-alanine N-acetyltransferase